MDEIIESRIKELKISAIEAIAIDIHRRESGVGGYALELLKICKNCGKRKGQHYGPAEKYYCSHGKEDQFQEDLVQSAIHSFLFKIGIRR